MTLTPLLSEPPAVQLHAFAAMAAFVLGLVQFADPKVTLPHRSLGWLWAAPILVVTISAFFISGIRTWRPFSPIHLFSVYTLVMVPVAIWHARHHAVRRHRFGMIGLFAGALLIAGALTFLPGRVMHDVLLANSQD